MGPGARVHQFALPALHSRDRVVGGGDPVSAGSPAVLAHCPFGTTLPGLFRPVIPSPSVADAQHGCMSSARRACQASGGLRIAGRMPSACRQRCSLHAGRHRFTEGGHGHGEARTGPGAPRGGGWGVVGRPAEARERLLGDHSRLPPGGVPRIVDGRNRRSLAWDGVAGHVQSRGSCIHFWTASRACVGIDRLRTVLTQVGVGLPRTFLHR